MRIHLAARLLRGISARNERGSVLVLALVVMTIIAALGIAVLAQEGSAFPVQDAYASVERARNAFDGAVDLAIQGLRDDPKAGVSVLEDGTATVCAQPGLPGATLGVFSFAGSGYDVHCAPTSTSGRVSGGVPADRVVTVTVCEQAGSCADRDIRVQAQIRIVDRAGTSYGSRVIVRSWARNPDPARTPAADECFALGSCEAR